MKIFVTGASGFVGGHVVEHFVAAGHEVLGMARSDSSAAKVEAFGGKAVRCSLDDVSAEHLEGVGAVVHCAAFVEEYGTRAQFWSINVEGTERVLEAAKRAKVPRFINIASEAAIFSGVPLLDVDEDYPYPAHHRFLYSETKAAGERAVLAAANDDFVALSLRPRLIWGPRDATIMPALKRMAQDGKWVWLDGGRARTSTTHVDNLVHAIELALSKGEGGRVYFIADDGETTLREFLSRYLRTEGVELKGMSLPGSILRPIARLVEGTWRAFGVKKTPPLTGFAVAAMSCSLTVNTSRAKAELGYVPVIDVDDGLAALAV